MDNHLLISNSAFTRILLPALWLGLLQAGCGPSDKATFDWKNIGRDTQEIIGGTASSQAQVGRLRAHLPNTPPDQFTTCTFTKISSNVLLTAAHCTTFPTGTVYTATFNANGTQGPFLPIQAVHHVAAFDPNHPENGHDVGVAILTDREQTITPFRLNKTHRTLANSTPRIIGYGRTSAGDPNSGGSRLETTITIQSENNQILLTNTNTSHMFCFGDSGGPGILSFSGQNRLVGIISASNDACTQGIFTRPEADDAFISMYNNTDLIEAWYSDLFGRQADDGGLLNWVLQLDAGAPRFTVARTLRYSREGHDAATRKAFRELLRRDPEPAALNTFANIGERDLYVIVASSAEYVNRTYCCPRYVGDWIANLYRDLLHRNASTPEVQAWVTVFNRYGYPAGYPAVAGMIIDSHERHQVFVRDLYTTYLRRAPDSGSEGWAIQMDRGLAPEDVRASFLAVPEYKDRVASVMDF